MRNENQNMTEPEVVKEMFEEIKTLGENFDNNVKSLTDRMDTIEVAFKRPGRQIEISHKSNDDVSNFCTAIKSLHGEKTSVMAEREAPRISTSEYQSYVKAYEQYLRIGKEVLPDFQVKSLQVGIDPAGGYLCPPSLNKRILETIAQIDPLRQLASIETITSGAWESLVDDEANSTLESVWEGETYGETTTPPNTKTQKLNKIKIPVSTLTARPLATQTLIEDSGTNIDNWLANKLAKKFSRDEGAAFVTGTGIGKPRGFLTYPNGTTFGTIEQINLGAAVALTADGLVDLLYALKEAYRTNACWIMNNLTIKAVRKLKDGEGNYIWERSLAAGQAPTLLGIPVYNSPSMPIISANALAVAVADWKEAYTIIDRLGISILRDPYSQKPHVEFYTRKRVGGDVTNFDAIKIGKIAA